MESAYRRAARFLPERVDDLVDGEGMAPRFIHGSDRFWFRERTPDRDRFLLVDPGLGSSQEAFNHRRLAADLTSASKRECDADRLPFDTIDVAPNGDLLFVASGQRWRYDVDGSLERAPSIPPDAVTSPDGSMAVYVEDDDLWLMDCGNGGTSRLTHDGCPERPYAYLSGPAQVYGRPLFVLWSPDSTSFAVERYDLRGVDSMHWLHNPVEQPGTRPSLRSLRLALPGDESITHAELFIGHPNGEMMPARLDPYPAFEYFTETLTYMRWAEDSTNLQLVYNPDRDRRALRFAAIDRVSGDAEVLVEESSQTVLLHSAMPEESASARLLQDGRVLWWSERSGWGHLWIVSGDEWKPVTGGEWVVRGVLAVDEELGEIVVTGSGAEAGSGPYRRHVYSARLDGGSPRLLTPEDGDHHVTMSPTGRYFVDSFSRVDLPTRTVVRSRDGGVIMSLGSADASRLYAVGWSPPEEFVVTAADGSTDLHGLMYRPTEVTTDERLPLIDCIYTGQHTIATAQRFGIHQVCDALAELGFGVITMDARGQPGRSRAFKEPSYRSLEGSVGIEDHVAAIPQLAERYPWIDPERVGVYGHSAGGKAAAYAILSHPDVYKVAISSAGDYDARWEKADWGETWIGVPRDNPDAWERQSVVRLAPRLRGRLLIACGDLDLHVHPIEAYSLVAALVAANKDFDFLLLPGRDHFYRRDSYFLRRCWDYFLRHLRNETPPRRDSEVEGVR